MNENPTFWDIPRDKSYPPDAGQCHNCGGWGCETCEQRGWLPAGHPKLRHCYREACGKTLHPKSVPVYCSDECAFLDATDE